MSLPKTDEDKRGVDLYLARSSRQYSDGAEQDDEPNTAIRLHSVVFRFANVVTLCALFLVCGGSNISRAQQPDFSIYARAVEFCRSAVKRPMAIDLDKRVLCFDGEISPGQDVSLVKGLKDKGLFVVRSPGGDAAAAVELANLLQDRRATVVVYDYCLLACASYLVFASAETIVRKDSLVAWRYTNEPPWCPSLVEPKDGGPKRLEAAPCSDAPPEYQSGYREFKNLSRDFYAVRGADPLVEWPPQSVFVRKVLRGKFEGTGTIPNYYWTWNPRHAASAIKTKIVYEAYPKTQEEIDAIASKISLYTPVIYDP